MSKFDLHNTLIPTLRFRVLLVIVLLLSFSTLTIASTTKSPSDVYRLIQLVAIDVQALRAKHKITTTWPKAGIERGREPRHVFQKALEILAKINQYRTNIAGMGGITIPQFLGRDITPDEVFSVVLRVHQELELLLDKEQAEHRQAEQVEQVEQVELAVDRITSNHVYTALVEVSTALEETLGLRSISPSEVYLRSQQVAELAMFLRRSQGLSGSIKKPPSTLGKLPNHALSAVLNLLHKIERAERNLWMTPLTVPEPTRRVIKPSDVYDAMGVAMAELQRIQFRLGLEREFPWPELQAGKTPDDVIQNTLWSVALLPTFELGKPLQQYDRQVLKKTPNQVFSITEIILARLTQYRRLRGIRVPPRNVEMIYDLKSQHVYGKALEVMEKVDVLRRRQQMGGLAVPRFPLRTITPSEVFDLTRRLDSELALMHEREGGGSKLWSSLDFVNEHTGKVPSDVFYNMQRISNLLDTILGSEGFTPSDVYREVIAIRQDVVLIAEALGESVPATIWKQPIFDPHVRPGDVLLKAKEVVNLIAKAKQRAGMFGIQNIALATGSRVTPSDVFNQVRLIETELTEFKVFLGIAVFPDRPTIQTGKVPGHVQQVLEGIVSVLQIILHVEKVSG